MESEARELGRDANSRVGVGGGIPKERRLLGREERSRGSTGTEDVALAFPEILLRELRTVTLPGMKDWLKAEPGRGDALGGVWVGAGSLDL